MWATINHFDIPFTLPASSAGKIILKNWIDGIDTDALSVSIQDDSGKPVATLAPQWTGAQWKATPVQFQIGDKVYTTWGNIQPDKFGMERRIGYTLGIKYLYTRKTEQTDPEPGV